MSLSCGGLNLFEHEPNGFNSLIEELITKCETDPLFTQITNKK